MPFLRISVVSCFAIPFIIFCSLFVCTRSKDSGSDFLVLFAPDALISVPIVLVPYSNCSNIHLKSLFLGITAALTVFQEPVLIHNFLATVQHFPHIKVSVNQI